MYRIYHIFQDSRRWIIKGISKTEVLRKWRENAVYLEGIDLENFDLNTYEYKPTKVEGNPTSVKMLTPIGKFIKV